MACRMFEARQAGEEAPLVHRILEETHFTNIHRELDTGTRCSCTCTCHSSVYLEIPVPAPQLVHLGLFAPVCTVHLARYLRYHLRGRSAQEKVFAIVLYRAVNRVETFEAFRRRGHRAIPSTRSTGSFSCHLSWSPAFCTIFCTPAPGTCT